VGKNAALGEGGSGDASSFYPPSAVCFARGREREEQKPLFL